MKRFHWLLILLLTNAPVLAQGAHDAANAHAEQAEGPNPFYGTIYQSIAAAVVFLSLLFLLKAKAWGPILKGLQDRENKIKSDLEHAEQAAREAQAKLKEYQAKLAQAHEETQKIIDLGRKEAERIAYRLQEETRKDITEQRARAQAQIQFAKELAVKELHAQTALLATQVAGKIIHRELKPDDHQNLVKEALAQYQSN